MYNNFTRKIIAVLAVVALVGFGSYAFAGRGGGDGYGHHGYGMDNGRHGYGMGYGQDDDRSDRDYEGDLTQDEIRQLEEAHEAFYKETKELRYKLDDKEVALSRELAGENPDKQKAAKLQKEISELRSKLDQKRLNHQLETRKIAPNAGRGWMRGYGSRGGKSCWR
jgi:Spy/CpxP family protein refolding chaperone